jgi:hypothetical protein
LVFAIAVHILKQSMNQIFIVRISGFDTCASSSSIRHIEFCSKVWNEQQRYESVSGVSVSRKEIHDECSLWNEDLTRVK